MHHHVDALNRNVEQPGRLDHLERLVDEGRGVDRDDGAHVPRWVLEGVRVRDIRQFARVRPRKAPPDAVTTKRRTSPWVPERRAWASAECSESTGTIWSARCRDRVTSGPPATRDSLFARASVLPAASAASVGRSPTEPVTPLSTTSAPIAAAATTASGPAITSMPGRASLTCVERAVVCERDKARTEARGLLNHGVGPRAASRERNHVK